MLQGQWIRIHPIPKRYPAAQTVDWASAVLYMDDDICVVNKPAGIPVQSHESNCAENVPRCLERALGAGALKVSALIACLLFACLLSTFHPWLDCCAGQTACTHSLQAG